MCALFVGLIQTERVRPMTNETIQLLRTMDNTQTFTVSEFAAMLQRSEYGTATYKYLGVAIAIEDFPKGEVACRVQGILAGLASKGYLTADKTGKAAVYGFSGDNQIAAYTAKSRDGSKQRAEVKARAEKAVRRAESAVLNLLNRISDELDKAKHLAANVDSAVTAAAAIGVLDKAEATTAKAAAERVVTVARAANQAAAAATKTTAKTTAKTK